MTNIHSDLFETGGQDKIDIDEIATLLNGQLKLLGDLVGWEKGSNANGRYFKHVSGVTVAVHRTAGVQTADTYEWTYPISFNEPPFVFVNTSQTTNSSSYSGVRLGVYSDIDKAIVKKWGSGGLNYPLTLIAIEI